MLPKLLEFIKAKQSEIVLAIAVVLISVIAFEGGKISAIHQLAKPLEMRDDQAHITVPHTPPYHQTNSSIVPTHLPATRQGLQVVASKNSTNYHFSWCTGAKKIKPANKVTFASEQEAQSRGLTLASNCQK